MLEYNKIIDYIIEQADRYDIKNLQFEEDIKFEIKRLTDTYYSRVLNKVNTNINSLVTMQMIMMNIENVLKEYVVACKKVLMDTFLKYYNVAYNNMSDLIDLGNELNAKFSQNVTEQRSMEYDEETIKFVQQHSFEMLTGHTRNKIERIRAELGNMFLSGSASKSNVRRAIEDILGVNRDKAEEIAQTELSRAYNFGITQKLRDYQRLTGKNMRKYWHGFKYDENTCEYCRPRIGNTYDIDDHSEELPAHPRCRCIWLPATDDWDKPLDLNFKFTIPDMDYNRDILHLRINNRLNINYASYMSDKAIEDYISGDRTNKVYDEINKARERYIKATVDSFEIARDNTRSSMSSEYNKQMNFWKEYVAGAMADNDYNILDKSYGVIESIMTLPWNESHIEGWNKLLDVISNFK